MYEANTLALVSDELIGELWSAFSTDFIACALHYLSAPGNKYTVNVISSFCFKKIVSILRVDDFERVANILFKRQHVTREQFSFAQRK